MGEEVIFLKERAFHMSLKTDPPTNGGEEVPRSSCLQSSSVPASIVDLNLPLWCATSQPPFCAIKSAWP